MVDHIEKLLMNKINKAHDIVANFDFKKGDYLGAEEQLSRFADSYARLSAEEAPGVRIVVALSER